MESQKEQLLVPSIHFITKPLGLKKPRSLERNKGLACSPMSIYRVASCRGAEGGMRG